MSRRSSLRASDQDREQVAERLRTAAVEGRLAPHELDERLGVALNARTYGELEPLVADLPAAPARRAPSSRLPVAAVVAGLVALVTLLALAGALLGGHGHFGHHGGSFAGLPLVWMVVIAVAWRMRMHRRRGWR